MSGKRVCLIGAGPSGMSVLYHASKLRKQGKNVPEIVCYEKQSNYGGLWNYTWRTGLGEFGEPVHGSMYHSLWSNGPKEALEFPDYTFEDHFGKPIPSFPPREVLFDYLQGRWKRVENLQSYIKFNHVVRSVQYNIESDDFSVTVKDLINDKNLASEKFDFVIVGTGHFSTPNVPSFPGIDKFPGRVMHSHDFREAVEFKGKRLLIVGSSYSAEDIALQCIKYGATSVICSWRTKPMGFHWPSEITERPLLTKIEGSTCYFKDNTESDVDAIILCTGYLHHYPFLADDLRMRSANILYPSDLYKGLVWMKSGNKKLMYIGAQDQWYTFTMFDAQGLWIGKYLSNEISIPDYETMEMSSKEWIERCQKIKDSYDVVKFQTDYVVDIANEANYGYDLDVADIFNKWVGHKDECIMTYRDKSFVSKFTGKASPKPVQQFMNAFDDSLEAYISQCK
eukprot:gene17287-19015_t